MISYPINPSCAVLYIYIYYFKCYGPGHPTSERSEQMRHRVQHENILYFQVLSKNRVVLCQFGHM